MKTKDIEKALVNEFLGTEPICSIRSNSIGPEKDFLTINNYNYLTEYEIKISKADFKADFKKPKHKKLSKGNGDYSRRFYYVTPQGLINLSDIPAYAGLIEVTASGSLIKRKKAPTLKSKRITDRQKNALMRSMMYRYLKLTVK